MAVALYPANIIIRSVRMSSRARGMMQNDAKYRSRKKERERRGDWKLSVKIREIEEEGDRKVTRKRGFRSGRITFVDREMTTTTTMMMMPQVEETDERR